MSALDRPAAELTVMDVYDIAAVLGQEFERVIDRFGCECLVGVVPRVVQVLEFLEVLVGRGTAGQETEELRGELDRLRRERSDRYEQEKKHQKELEQVEDVWRGEVQDLLSQITQLQAENKRLSVNLSLKESPITEEDPQEHEGERLKVCFYCRYSQFMQSQRMRWTALSRRQTNLVSPCRSCGMSCMRGMNSKPRFSCSRKSWHITKAVMEFGEESSPALAFEKDAFELTVEDVYDISYVIGRDLLKISSTGEEVSDLQFRIVRVLEMFETLVNKYNLSVEELKMERDNLKAELDRIIKEGSSSSGQSAVSFILRFKLLFGDM
ncbi:hypothetical protein GOODEAATRI_006086 [Goodea atripinnis]|uniref:RH1 domain-containing protein n=1 Tax=Goodea atripinnis TaxID=208336 RepID=A0ABV0PVR4_9TELE